MPHAKLNGVNLYYEASGSGTAVVLTHGFAGSTKMWLPQVEALSKEYQVITYDIRGHGQSDAPADRALYSWGIAIEDLHQLLTSLGVKEAIVGGLSLGGIVSFHYYLKHPEMTKALIIADSGPGFRNPQSMAAWDQERYKLTEVLEKGGMAAYMASPYANTTYYTTSDVMVAHSPIGLSNINIALQTNQEMVPLEKIKVPALVIVGSGDTNSIPPANYMHRKIPNSRLAVIPQAGHGSNVDQPAIFNRTVLDFLKDNGL